MKFDGSKITLSGPIGIIERLSGGFDTPTERGDARRKELACKIAGMLFLADLPGIGPFRQFDEFDSEAIALTECKSIPELRGFFQKLHGDDIPATRLIEAISQPLNLTNGS